jgi:hypothetical protein
VDDPVINNKETGVLCNNVLTLNANPASPARTNNVKGYWEATGVDKWESNNNTTFKEISTVNNITVTMTPNSQARFK